MLLIIGAKGSGKLDYIKSLGFSDDEIADGVLDDRPAVYNLQDMVFASTGDAPPDTDALLNRLLTKKVVACDEVGSGVIPVDNRLRLTREATGRLCIALAKNASAVIRTVCGIPTAIKGVLPSKKKDMHG